MKAAHFQAVCAGVVVGAAVAVAVAAPAVHGQVAVYSLEGTFGDVNDRHDFDLSLSGTVNPSDEFRITNFGGSGGTNGFGTAISGGGIRSALRMFNGGVPTGTQSYDAGNRDASLDFAIPILTTSNLELDLQATDLGSTNAWAMDLVGPANRFSLDDFSPAFGSDSAVTSMAMFAEAGGSTTFTNNRTLTVPGTLNISRPVGSTGSATFAVGSGTTTFNNVTQVHPGGTLNATAGMFNANGGLVVNGGTVNANPANFTLPAGPSLDAFNNGQVNFTDAFNLAGGRTFEFSGGADFTTGSQFIVANGSTGTLIADGTGSTLNLNTGGAFNEIAVGSATGVVTIRNGAALNSNSSNFGIARSSTNSGTDGTLNVQSGADATLNSIRIGNIDGNDGVGTINVTGSGSTLTQTGTSTLTLGNADTPGNGGIHTINVNGSGVFNSGTGTTTIRKTGTLSLNTGGAFNANGNVNVDAGALNISGGGFNLATGKKLTASNAADLGFGGSYELDEATTVEVNGGAQWTLGSFLDIGNSTDGTLIVDGVGSAVTSNTAGTLFLDWGISGGDAQATVRNSALVDVSGASRIELGKGGTGTIDVESEGSLNVGSLNVGVGSSGDATVNVSGSVSSLTQNGAATLNVGTGSGATGQVNVFDSADLTTGTGATVINATGTIDVNTGGTLIANGAFTNNGGTVRGNGTLTAANGVDNNGTVVIDAQGSDISLDINGDYVQGPAGRLEIGRGGGFAAFDRLLVNGDIDLGGELAFTTDTTPLDEFGFLGVYGSVEPIVGNVVNANGVFDTVSGHIFGDGTAIAVLYDATSADVLGQRVLYGDANLDGFIAQADLDAVLLNWGNTAAADDASWISGDLSGDGFVAQADLDAVLLNWGSGTPPNTTTIPEPSTLAFSAMLGLTGFRRRHRNK